MNVLSRHVEWFRGPCPGGWNVVDVPAVVRLSEADDVASIRARMKEIEQEERATTDIDAAYSEYLDLWGRRYGVERAFPGESDYNFRLRIKSAMS